MSKRHFNLVAEPWIKVIYDSHGSMTEVSLIDLFKNAYQFKQLAGETRSQDFAVLRLLLAILETVYSRFDAENQAYDWLQTDDLMQVRAEVDDYNSDDLLETWKKLYQQGGFSDVVVTYLEKYKNSFDFFGDNPFYQVTQEQYDGLVPADKRVSTGKGTVSVKQINRSISESANSPALFAPKTEASKDQIALPELIRWIITYQNFTGATDKTKILTPNNFSIGAGWLYRLNPVFANGQNLFEALMLNLVLINKTSQNIYQVQKPVWEYANSITYIEERKKEFVPDNVAALYTSWSRALYLDWLNNDQPIIFSAGIPMFDPNNAFIEPFTVWRFDNKKKPAIYRPATKSNRSLSRAMWRNFGDYIDIYQDGNSGKQPGIVDWLHLLKERGLIARNTQLQLSSDTLISDGNATSQSPAAEISDTMSINADVLFDLDGSQYWPRRIEDAVDLAQLVERDYWQFIKTISKIRGFSSSNDTNFVNQETAKYYEQLNLPFKKWLADLTVEDDRDQKVNVWKQQLKLIVSSCVQVFMQSVSSRDIRGVVDEKSSAILNVFTAYNQLNRNVNRDLN
ncbi:type I-E CRISPR-associated protein Cse1/CasA [Oenococcus sicerae]|uniref:Type I-E CRISPR-associated protein Cse1/CasA n=1 Tax=Oenococcus sicerae TaxID=2203724 RepID=A0ABX5QP36_9LACO|nr:type I-E CRISPR-associated protein Cse1/CasA [Oenococcus sicerae]QAS70546.1 type I-E CRISPR-associated protein Cse1/CasA [Oenococcus sicerae]